MVRLIHDIAYSPKTHNLELLESSMGADDTSPSIPHCMCLLVWQLLLFALVTIWLRLLQSSRLRCCHLLACQYSVLPQSCFRPALLFTLVDSQEPALSVVAQQTCGQ